MYILNELTHDTIPVHSVAVPPPRAGYIDHGIAKVLISAAVRT